MRSAVTYRLRYTLLSHAVVYEERQRTQQGGDARAATRRSQSCRTRTCIDHHDPLYHHQPFFTERLVWTTEALSPTIRGVHPQTNLGNQEGRRRLVYRQRSRTRGTAHRCLAHGSRGAYRAKTRGVDSISSAWWWTETTSRRSPALWKNSHPAGPTWSPTRFAETPAICAPRAVWS